MKNHWKQYLNLYRFVAFANFFALFAWNNIFW